MKPIDEYDERMASPTLRLDYPETFSQHLASCPYGCDDEGLLENPFIGGAERCVYCN